jgi:hypothetical protein
MMVIKGKAKNTLRRNFIGVGFNEIFISKLNFLKTKPYLSKKIFYFAVLFQVGSYKRGLSALGNISINSSLPVCYKIVPKKRRVWVFLNHPEVSQLFPQQLRKFD